MSISGKARLAGIVGWPVAQSLSPRLHSYWLAEHDIDGAYVPMPVQREEFAGVVKALRVTGFAGLNVTVPHKEAAFALAHRVDGAAQAAGAVNLLLFENGRIIGRNTDAPGLRASLTESLGLGSVAGKPCVILGAGGGARAAVLALSELGASEIRIVNRSRPRSEALIAALKPVIPAALSGMDWVQAARGAALLVNATSGGMQGKDALDISLDALPPGAAVCDIVYNPLETALLKAARQRGHRIVDGLGMLMHQAVPSFAALFGVTPTVTPALRAHLVQALHG